MLIATSKTTMEKLLNMPPIAYGISFIISIMLESKPLIMAMIIFIFVDLLTGLWKAIKIKEEITSKALRRTVEKLATYFLVILLAQIFDKIFIKIDLISISTIVAGLILLIEFKSVTENMGEITGNKVFTKIYKVVETIFKKKSND